MKSSEGARKRKARTSSHSSKIEESCIPFLSEEIIFIILTWVPADVLYCCMRYVCKRWDEIISSSKFKEQHHPSRSSGLFFAQNNFGCFANVGKTKATLTELELPPHYRVRGGCDGLLLLEHGIDRIMHIANPLTRRITKVPQFRAHPFRHTLSFVCIRSTKEYKVVLTTYSFLQGTYQCAVLTLGEGCAWKLIHSPELSGYLDDKVSTYCVGQMVFWIDIHAPHIVGLCAESEETYRLPSPTVDGEGCRKSYIPGGELLSLVVQYDHKNLVEIWSLFDPKGVAGWRKMYKIDFGATISLYNIDSQNIPVTWVNKEVVIFHDDFPSDPIFGYNVKNGKSIKIGNCKHLWPPVFCCEFVCDFTWIKL